MTTYRYAEMTWSACREAAYSGRVAVLPVATYEDHGYHLPIDTDVRLCTESASGRWRAFRTKRC